MQEKLVKSRTVAPHLGLDMWENGTCWCGDGSIFASCGDVRVEGREHAESTHEEHGGKVVVVVDDCYGIVGKDHT